LIILGLNTTDLTGVSYVGIFNIYTGLFNVAAFPLSQCHRPLFPIYFLSVNLSNTFTVFSGCSKLPPEMIPFFPN